MELLFVALGGAILGLGARYLLPGRHTHGSVLVPAIGVIAASGRPLALAVRPGAPCGPVLPLPPVSA